MCSDSAGIGLGIGMSVSFVGFVQRNVFSGYQQSDPDIFPQFPGKRNFKM